MVKIRGNVAGVLGHLEETTGVPAYHLIHIALYERYPELYASLDTPPSLKAVFILDEEEAKWLKTLAHTHKIKIEDLLRTLLQLTPK